jgi:23S rRNA pseudouridine1911/1915/1917 synthase
MEARHVLKSQVADPGDGPETTCLVVATRGDAGRRLDLVLLDHVRDAGRVTRTRAQRWIGQGRVHINGLPADRPSRRVAQDDRITVTLVRESRQATIAEDLPLAVLFEDDHLLAVDKPAGLVVHPTYRHPRGTILNGLLWRARAWPEGRRPSLVGRLDRLTSGVLLVAKTPAAHARLQRSLTGGEGEKDYLAVVYGRVRDARGRIELPLGRDPRDTRRVVVTPEGAASRTDFTRLARAPAEGLSLLHCRLVTGRMHQIRVHLAARGWPIVGDPVYGEPRWPRVDAAAMGAALSAFPRQALHAWRVRVPHPILRTPLTIEAPVPDDLADLLRVTGLDRGVANAAGARRT